MMPGMPHVPPPPEPAKAPTPPKTWMRGGSRRFNLLEVCSYEPTGCQIYFLLKNGVSLYWSPDYKEGVLPEEQIKKTIEALDGYFGVIQ